MSTTLTEGQDIKCRNCDAEMQYYESNFNGQDIGHYCADCMDLITAGTVEALPYEEPGVGSRQRIWACQCPVHMSKRGRGALQEYPGPYAFRGPASTPYSVFCQFCDAVFTLQAEMPATKRKRVPCGVHCPPEEHSHV